MLRFQIWKLTVAFKMLQGTLSQVRSDFKTLDRGYIKIMFCKIVRFSVFCNEILLELEFTP